MKDRVGNAYVGNFVHTMYCYIYHNIHMEVSTRACKSSSYDYNRYVYLDEYNTAMVDRAKNNICWEVHKNTIFAD